MKPAADITDFALESMFTKARKQMDLAAALRHVLAELDALRCSQISPIVVAVVDEVAARFGTTREDLIGRDEKRLHIRPRVVAWLLLHHRFDMSYPKIGAAFSGRHHSGVLTQVAGLDSLLQVDERLASQVADIEAAVRRQMAQRAA